MQLFLLGFVHRFVHSDMHALNKHQYLLYAKHCWESICPLAARTEFLLYTKTKQFIWYHYYTYNWNIGLIKPNLILGNLIIY